MEEAIKKRVRFQSFYEKYENDDKPISMAEVYENKSDGRSIRSSNSDA